jgi:hypothetical protein
MEELKEAINQITEHKYSLERLSQLIDSIEETYESIAYMDEATKQLEEYEAKIRGLRQILILKSRRFWARKWILEQKHFDKVKIKEV